MLPSRKAVQKVLANSFTVGWDYQSTVYTYGDKSYSDSKSPETNEKLPVKIKNLRELSENLQRWFHAPYNYSRDDLDYSVKAKVSGNTLSVVVEWPELDVKAVKSYQLWVGNKGTPLGKDNLEQLLSLVKKWDMSEWWEYES